MIKVGVVGTHQLSFPGEKEKHYAAMIEGMKKNAQDMGFELVAYAPLVITEAEANRAREYMEERKVDFLLILNISYSAGNLVAALYRIKGARVGIWSLPEGAAEGCVPYNSFCSANMYQGINAKYLRDYKIKSKWFYGYPDDARFRRRLQVSVRALGALKAMNRARVALIGGIAPGFNDLYFDERKVISKFDGITINRLHEYGEIIKIAEKITDAEVEACARDLKEDKIQRTPNAAKHYALSLKMYLAYKKLIAENAYDAVAISCWPKFQDDYKYSVCSVVGMLNDDKIVAACEGDLMSAISMLALQEMSGDSTSLMDFSAFDEEDESILLWHCGPASKKFCQKNGYTLSENYSGMAHEPGKITGIGVARDMEFDPMRATVFRFSGDMEKYLELDGKFMGKGKPSFHGSRGWFTDLKMNGQAIGALDFTNTVLSSGFEHHYPIAQGDLSEEVAEFGAWLGVPSIKKIAYKNCLQEAEE